MKCPICKIDLETKEEFSAHMTAHGWDAWRIKQAWYERNLHKTISCTLETCRHRYYGVRLECEIQPLWRLA